MALSQQKDAKNDGNSSLLTKMALFGLGSVLCYTYFSKKSPNQMTAETECKSDEQLLGVFNQHIPKITTFSKISTFLGRNLPYLNKYSKYQQKANWNCLLPS